VQTEEQVKAEFQGASPARFSTINIRHRGRLPHWERECGLYFVTFRTCDSLPKQCLEAARKQLLKSGKDGRLRQVQFEELLDRCFGSRPFNDPRCAEVVAGSLRALNGKYRLLAWCIMPNHVHFVARLLPGNTLAQVMHSVKSFSAKQINRILEKNGRVWQREYYDRLIRDSDELERAVAYVVNNPQKAGLLNWNWVENLSGIDDK
jgi:REP element-mobilizing transposase RayT